MNVWARSIFSVFAVLGMSASQAQAVIKAPTGMHLFVNDSTHIVQVRVKDFTPDKNTMTLEVEQDLRGKLEQRTFTVNWRINPKPKDDYYLAELLKRYGPGQQAILFINDGGKFWRTMQRKGPVTYGCANGNWFFMESTTAADGKVTFKLTQGEPWLRGTFKGSTAELNKLLTDHLAGKAKLPEAAKEPPGFGPVFEAKK